MAHSPSSSNEAHSLSEPSPWVRRWSHLIVPASEVLDLACGQGRHMRYLAACGHRVLGVDRSAEALSVAGAFGRVRQADLEDGPWPLAGERFAAVVVTNYLWRPRLPELLACVAPGGVLMYETFAQGNETVGKPARADFLLAPGELLACCAQAGLRVIAYEDGFIEAPARFVQRVTAVRPLPQTIAAPAHHLLSATPS